MRAVVQILGRAGVEEVWAGTASKQTKRQEWKVLLEEDPASVELEV